jgi:L-seryl-tRNA(Ser) seleniumtransferase
VSIISCTGIDVPSTRTADLRALPSVDEVLRTQVATLAVNRFGRTAVVDAVRATLAAARAHRTPPDGPDQAAATALARLEARDSCRLMPVYNLTGTVLHTNLGRALLAEAAIEAATAVMRNAVALEFDLDTGRRGERDDHVRGLLCELTGAEDATVVNNNAAAVLIVLNTLSKGGETVVSRGELIEIGGAFRMPDIMARAGTKLIEIGTTNRTHREDYAAAIGPRTRLILKVHTSNYRIEGFTAQVEPRTLAQLARAADVRLVHDLGSGTLIDLARFGLGREPTVAEAVADGADLVTFSGDKLLGGPQAGLIVGRKDLIARINRNPMKRALRIDKIRLAVLEATLKLYRDPDRLAVRLPTIGLLARPQADIERLAQRLAPAFAAAVGGAFTVKVVACASQIGSGALPLKTVPSAGLGIRPTSKRGAGGSLRRLAEALRRLPVPILGRLEDQALILDLRGLDEDEGFLANLAALAPDRNADALA